MFQPDKYLFIIGKKRRGNTQHDDNIGKLWVKEVNMAALRNSCSEICGEFAL